MCTLALPRKEMIIITAINLLDEVGMSGLTTKAIAQRQNITEAAIYKHFNSKKDIILEILRKHTTFDQAIRDSILESNMDGKSGIFYYVKQYAEYYQDYPQIMVPVFSCDFYRYDEDIKKMLRKITEERYRLMLKLVIQAVDDGDLPSDTDCQGLTDGLYGAVWSTTLLWKMDQCSFDLKDRLIKSVQVLLHKT